MGRSSAPGTAPGMTAVPGGEQVPPRAVAVFQVRLEGERFWSDALQRSRQVRASTVLSVSHARI